ncbi:Regulator of telomere elongation helicase 1 [Fasciola gigantica]|uniref:Regulator of telomere elongation helicase 1 n=1 Tax=Fasciola gigantica TaxID=46835 RepID=A0A504YJD0_FASGI|nr:Regulator of telomere elongation helicase 1 [Fasciola gigantica]
MPTVNISGVGIEFPHEPYPCQVEYMKELLTALNNNQNAILESPTGTGKTLCLLCTSLAWISSISSGVSLRNPNRHESKPSLGPTVCFLADPFVEVETTELRPPLAKVIFASRTHSQLAQAVKVLKQTAYAHRNVSVIGSRDQLCLLPEVNMLESNSAKVLACRSRVQTRSCEYYRNFDMKRDNITNTLKADGVVDIEDLVTLGKSTRCCPYYMSRELKSNADLIFMPYNYLLDPKIRRLYNIELDNTVVIFDEAHNIEQVCEDAASVFLASSVLASAIEYLRTVCEVVFDSTNDLVDADNQAVRELDANANILAVLDITRAGENKIRSLNLERLLLLKGELLKLSEDDWLNSGQLIELERLVDGLEIPEAGLTKETEFLLDLFGRAGITSGTKEIVFETIEEVLSAAASAENLKLRKPKGISEISEFLKVISPGISDNQCIAAYLLSLPYLFSIAKECAPVPSFFHLAFAFEAGFARCYRLLQSEMNRSILQSLLRRTESGITADLVVQSLIEHLIIGASKSWRAMQDLIRGRVRCVILTSGTLYPAEPIETELNM